jgi:phosphate transport system protein
MQGLVERDADLIEVVLSGDMPVNELHIQIDDLCLKLLALHSPMAADLRGIMAAIKINSDLERVGDMAVNIGEAARRYAMHAPVKKLIDIPRMGTTAQSALRDALTRMCGATFSWRNGCWTKTTTWTRSKARSSGSCSRICWDPSTIEPALDLIRSRGI